MKSKSTLAEVLRRARNAAGLTGEAVAAKLKERGIELSSKTVYGYERGTSAPNVSIFLCLCDIYGIRNISEEFGGRAAPPQDGWSAEQYEAFFSSPVFDQLFLLIHNGTPGFEGYRDKLETLFPGEAARADFNFLYSTFRELNERQQAQLFFYLEQIKNGRSPRFTPSEDRLVSLYRSARATDPEPERLDKLISAYCSYNEQGRELLCMTVENMNFNPRNRH